MFRARTKTDCLGKSVVVSVHPLAVPERESGALPLCAERVSILIRPSRGTFPKREGKGALKRSPWWW